MPPPVGSVHTLLSPAELSFLHSSLALDPPVRPDLRTPTQFRPLVAETDILSSTNGSARICFSDGTEAIVGIKAELEKSNRSLQPTAVSTSEAEDVEMDEDTGPAEQGLENKASGRPRETNTTGKILDTWLEVSIEIPGFRDDDNLPVFLSSMLSETLRSDVSLLKKLWINDHWHWKLFIDILSLSSPLSYPLPLLSLTTHLALLNTSLPRLTSEPNDDPMFDDDWAAAVPMYPRPSESGEEGSLLARPSVTLLVMTVADNIIFDPSKEELAVADNVLAVSVVPTPSAELGRSGNAPAAPLKLIAIRTIDPPSRLTPLGIPNSINPATSDDAASSDTAKVLHADTAATQEALAEREKGNLWTPPRGGIKRALISRIIKMVLEDHGVGQEVLSGLASVEI